jgi:pimeloyl-ACP methyl ester carboxylesterase
VEVVASEWLLVPLTGTPGPLRPAVRRERRPPTLVATGANDEIFPEQAVRQIVTDHLDTEYHALQAGHFALEDKAAEIAALMRDFLARTCHV